MTREGDKIAVRRNPPLKKIIEYQLRFSPPRFYETANSTDLEVRVRSWPGLENILGLTLPLVVGSGLGLRPGLSSKNFPPLQRGALQNKWKTAIALRINSMMLGDVNNSPGPGPARAQEPRLSLANFPWHKMQPEPVPGYHMVKSGRWRESPGSRNIHKAIYYPPAELAVKLYHHRLLADVQMMAMYFPTESVPNHQWDSQWAKTHWDGGCGLGWDSVRIVGTVGTNKLEISQFLWFNVHLVFSPSKAVSAHRSAARVSEMIANDASLVMRTPRRRESRAEWVANESNGAAEGSEHSRRWSRAEEERAAEVG
ncbi:hypothetical protein FB451DRAFT_1193601 [Mycena latifolia]|nr:hypothetical protein FB451DRAFT_1193601 [Mycena latifolia]